MPKDIQEYFSNKIISSSVISHSGNNQMHDVLTDSGRFLLKRYSPPSLQIDNYDRGQREFSAISSLWKLGFRTIPRPIFFYPNDSVGIYSFLDGSKVLPKDITEKEIANMVLFLSGGNNIYNKDKKSFQNERPCCFSLEDYLKRLDSRANSINESFEGIPEARDYFYDLLLPKKERLKSFLKGRKSEFKPETLSLSEKVVSYGDFGVHNMLVNGSEYFFLDFEYCGLDDPAKQILGFLSHDKHRDISSNLRSKFLSRYKRTTRLDCNFEERLNLLSSWAEMDWAFIYMNPFSRKYLSHMGFSHDQTSLEFVRSERMQKSITRVKRLSFLN